MNAPEEMRAALRSLSVHDWGRFTGGPLPAPADAPLSALVARFAAADQSTRDSVRQSLTRTHHILLLSFALRLASLAVRERSTERLVAGLNALALAGGSPNTDWRDDRDTLIGLRDAAERLRVRSGEAFLAAARIALPRATPLIADYRPRGVLRRTVENVLAWFTPGVTVKRKGWPDGFRYVFESFPWSNERRPVPVVGDREQQLQRVRQWTDAANVFVKDVDAKVPCSRCAYEFLAAEHIVYETLFDCMVYCVSCGERVSLDRIPLGRRDT